jgi:hypothetical protein
VVVVVVPDAWTTAVGADVAVVLPSAFFAWTLNRSVRPTSTPLSV